MTNEKIPVPCGKCPECLSRRTSGWSFRLMQQDKQSISAYFLTLTYDTLHVPITKNGFMDLSRRDVQLFVKRLRKNHELPNGKNDNPIKYYAVGEYGGRTMRPHYHVILFNSDIKLIQTSWQKGSVHYGVVTGASIGYTLKYMMKPSKIPLHRNDDRIREFSLMSKGLGVGYITESILNWHHKDLRNRMYVNIDDGKKIAMPRYFKNKIYTEAERKQIAYFAIKKNLEMAARLERKGEVLSSQQEAECIKAAFAKMHYNAERERNKI